MVVMENAKQQWRWRGASCSDGGIYRVTVGEVIGDGEWRL